jgi:hypothetical protein
VQADKRLLVFDFPRRDWPRYDCECIDGLAALADRLSEVRAGPARISYRPRALTSVDFGLWGQAALAWGHFAPCTIVAEELADVVNPGKAPRGWGELVRGGLAYGNTIHGITQRVQETDRSIFGNATVLRIFGTDQEDDARYIAKASGIPLAKIQALKPLEYLEKDKGARSLDLKTLSF